MNEFQKISFIRVESLKNSGWKNESHFLRIIKQFFFFKLFQRVLLQGLIKVLKKFSHCSCIVSSPK